MLYTDGNNLNEQLRCPARLMAIVQDNSQPGNVYHPVLQWAGHRTKNDSVLFDEYVFEHDVNPNDTTSSNIHSADSIQGPVFVIDSECKDVHRILVAHDRDTWADMFHSIND